MSDLPDDAGRKRRPHAQIHLPPLSADYALTLVGIFERAIEAVWRAHGQAMGDLQKLRTDHERARAAGFVVGNIPDDSKEVEF